MRPLLLLRDQLDLEEGRLLAILTDYSSKVAAASLALSHPARSMLMQEYRKLADDLEIARAGSAEAAAVLREYRKLRG